MKLLYVVNGNGLSPALGGSVVRSATIARHLAQSGHNVEVMTTAGGRSACRSLGLDVPFHVLPSALFTRHERSIADRAVGYVVSTIAGAATARKYASFDIVYSDSDYPCDVVPAEMIAKRFGTAWIAMVHHIVTEGSEDPAPVRNAKGLMQDLALRRIARRASRILTYATPAGDGVSERLRLFGAAESSIERVHNGFDGENLSGIVAGAASDAVLVGGLRAGKGLSEVVPIWRDVVDHLPAARLRVVGGMTASNRRLLEAEISKAGLGNAIVLEGARSHDETMAIVKGARIMIAASLQEGWGIAVCESLACGVPVVGYDLPAYRTLFHGGLISVPPGDRPAFAAQVRRLLKDETLREHLAREAPRAVSAYEWRVVANRDLSVFQALMVQ